MRFIKRNNEITDDFAENLAKNADIPFTLARLLAERGITDEKSVKKYLAPSWEDINDPFLFDNMQDSVELINEMIEAEVPIAVYSDFDCDGVSGAAILKKTLESLGADVTVYIPDRFTEGYGTNPDAIRMLADNAGLIITVDCGITSVDDVALARDMGAEVIILDHHECGELPDTPFIINPKRPGESYPEKNLCGAALAFKLAQALIGDSAERYIDIAGMATIGDLVSLTGENRAIATLGMEKIKTNPCEGIKQLALKAGVNTEKLSSYGISFGLVPRINVAGRLEHANKALRLLLEDEPVKAAEYAEYLCLLNEKRKTIQKDITELAEKQIGDGKDRLLIIKGMNFHRGVVGLAASKITSEYNRPTIVLSEEDGRLTGSARSIDGINIHEIMSAAADKYIKFGGHSQAAGVTMPAEAFDEVKKILLDYAEKTVNDELLEPFTAYDDEIIPADATMELAELIERMEPFGEDNPMPVFLMRDVSFTDVYKMGRMHEHSKANVGALKVLRFNGELVPNRKYVMCGNLEINEYNNVRSVQYRITACECNSAVRGAEVVREMKYIRSFLREASSLDAEPNYSSIDSFIKDFDSFKGNAVMAVCTEIGELALKSTGYVCPFFEGNAPSEPEKCIVYNLKAVPQWCERLYLCASPALKRKYKNAVLYMSLKCRRTIISEAKNYFVSSEELPAFSDAFKSAEGSYESISELLNSTSRFCGGNVKNMWFALNVFFEQKLIEFKKCDKISLIYKKTALNAEAGRLYRLFEEFVRGERK